MTPREANGLLEWASSFDPKMLRRSDDEREQMAIAWAAALDNVPVDVARTAVTRHYATSRDAVMPADIRELTGISFDEADDPNDITLQLTGTPTDLTARQWWMDAPFATPFGNQR